MRIIDVKNADISKNPHNVDARRIYDDKYAQAVHLTLNPGESLKRHITPVDVFFYVIGPQVCMVSIVFYLNFHNDCQFNSHYDSSMLMLK